MSTKPMPYLSAAESADMSLVSAAEDAVAEAASTGFGGALGDAATAGVGAAGAAAPRVAFKTAFRCALRCSLLLCKNRLFSAARRCSGATTVSWKMGMSELSAAS